MPLPAHSPRPEEHGQCSRSFKEYIRVPVQQKPLSTLFGRQFSLRLRSWYG